MRLKGEVGCHAEGRRWTHDADGTLLPIGVDDINRGRSILHHDSLEVIQRAARRSCPEGGATYTLGGQLEPSCGMLSGVEMCKRRRAA